MRTQAKWVLLLKKEGGSLRTRTLQSEWYRRSGEGRSHEGHSLKRYIHFGVSYSEGPMSCLALTLHLDRKVDCSIRDGWY